MNRISQENQERIVAALMEGVGINGTARLLNISENAVARHQMWLGTACMAYHEKFDRNLPCKLIQCDEVVAFIRWKEQNVPAHMADNPEVGKMQTWVGMCADSRFVISWRIGKWTTVDSDAFCYDLRRRVATPRPQISADGLPHYRASIEAAFGDSVDFATIKKITDEPKIVADRYERPTLKEMRVATVTGNPDPDEISTSLIERQHATLRHMSSRYKRHHYTISKKLENMQAALAMHYMFYNYCRIHSTLRVTPAMELGVADHVWSIEELVALMPPRAANRPQRYRKRGQMA